MLRCRSIKIIFWIIEPILNYLFFPGAKEEGCKSRSRHLQWGIKYLFLICPVWADHGPAQLHGPPQVRLGGQNVRQWCPPRETGVLLQLHTDCQGVGADKQNRQYYRNQILCPPELSGQFCLRLIKSYYFSYHFHFTNMYHEHQKGTHIWMILNDNF